LNELPFDYYQEANILFEKDVLGITVDSALEERDLLGGTAPLQVRKAIELLRVALSQ